MSSAPDAVIYYQELITRKARKKEEGSGLGLARICAEGEMKVALRVDDADMVTIEATTHVGGAA